MNVQELRRLADEIGYPHGYRRTRRPVEPPYLVYACTGSDPIASDTRMHGLFSGWRIELYTVGKNPEAERRVEDVLDAAGLRYSKDETDLPDANLLEIIYEFEEVET